MRTATRRRTTATKGSAGDARDARAAARLRELVLAEVASFRRHLRRAAQGRDRSVHEARKALQRLRATVMLFAGVRPRLAEQENVRLRTLRRRMGPLRDGAARAETLRLLARRKAWLPWRA
ncbi:MAG TPA: CHAD domain-containing protein, partial [Xanthomonadales bacterium]|nr:CHAD domain-containing protein [Xanthomonadales bacterium]